MKIIRDIDFNKYHTFVLEYYKTNDMYHTHMVRPSETTYAEITNISKTRIYTLEGAVLTFDKDETVEQILIECAMIGVSIDFIDILIENDKKNAMKYGSNYKCVQQIDMHRKNVHSQFDKINAPRFYVAINTRKTDILKFLVVDRYCQDQTISFLSGKYDKRAVIAGFKTQNDARTACNNYIEADNR